MLINLIISDSHFFVKKEVQKLFKSDDIIKYDLNSSSVDDVIFDSSTISLFDEHKNILIENSDELFSKSYDNHNFENYLNNPSDCATLVFIASKVDLSSKFYKLFKSKFNIIANDLKKAQNVNVLVRDYLKNNGITMSDKALNYLKDSCLNDYDLIINEIEKLRILSKNNIFDDLVYNLVCITPNGNNFRFIDALMEYDSKSALECVNNFSILNIDISKMLALIAWNVRVCYLIKKYRKDSKMIDEIIRLYKLEYSFNNHVKRANMRSLEELEDLLLFLADLDHCIKNYSVDKDIIGYYLINKFC